MGSWVVLAIVLYAFLGVLYFLFGILGMPVEHRRAFFSLPGVSLLFFLRSVLTWPALTLADARRYRKLTNS